jgi:hypothetical protein
MFSFSFQLATSFFPTTDPSPVGPRNCGQFWATSEDVSTTARKQLARRIHDHGRKRIKAGAGFIGQLSLLRVFTATPFSAGIQLGQYQVVLE